jgi:predicted nucleic acid-binding protein
MGLIRDLGQGPVALDTAVFICFLEEHPRFLPIVEPLFHEIDEGRKEGLTSILTLLEVLVVPYRAGDLELIRRYEALLTGSRGIRMVGIDRKLLHGAALLRARHRLRTPDALQIAAGLLRGCKTFVTNDRDLPEISGLRILQLRDYLKK